jgi:hypothetical protein
MHAEWKHLQSVDPRRRSPSGMSRLALGVVPVRGGAVMLVLSTRMGDDAVFVGRSPDGESTLRV